MPNPATRHNRSTSTTRTSSATRPRRVDVWVVEDNKMLREALADVIDEQDDMRCGLAVECCEDFLAALEQDAMPDIVLMDVELPGRSGIEGIERISSVSPATKVVVLTVHGEDDKVFDAICAGASGYLLKPSSPEAILDAVREVHRGAAPVNPYIARKMLTWFKRLAPPRTPENDYGLTRRELDILQLLVDGLTMYQIAGELKLSYHTVVNHLRNVYRKLHVRSRSHAVTKALREDLV